MKVNGGTCPSLETIGAFVDGRFKDREREVVADHLATCETCYFVFSEAARTRTTAKTKGDVVPFPPRRVTWKTVAAGLAAAAVIVLAVNVWSPFGASGDERALATLVTSVGTTRMFEPRLTGGFAYAPVRSVRNSDATTSLSPEVRITIAEIEKQFPDQPVAGAAAIVAGEPGRAISILETASRNDPNDPRILSDLSAAYLVRAEQLNSKADASQALAMANRALELDRLMPEAMFNRALALQLSGATDDARTAWQAYLTIDGRSGWAEEARTRLRILSTQP
jgi:hypothetical protein